MTTSAGLATVADLLMLWTALASGSHIEPVPATAMSYVADCCGVGHTLL
jgi:hypothetical protein